MDKETFDFDIHFFIKIAMKYWLVMVILMLFGAFTGFALSRWVISPVYQAKTSLYVGLDTNKNEEKMSDVYSSVMLGSKLVNDYKEFITTRRVKTLVYDEVIQKNLLPVPFDYEASVALKRNTRVVVISIQSHDPNTAKVIANVTARVFEKLSKDIMKLNNVQVIDTALLPTDYIKPKTRNNIVLGAFLGILLAVGISILAELLDRTIKNPEEASEKLNLPVFGTINEIGEDDDSSNKKSGKKKPLKGRIGIVSLDKKRSQVAESFRMLRTNLHYSIPENEKASIFMVTSSMPAEGKSMVVSNLAVVTADSGKKVLLIDCDLRKPATHKVFEMTRDKGLVNYLASEIPYEETMKKNVLDVSLDIIPCGPIPPNPTELLMSDKFKTLLDRAAEEYDYIFFDAPPCMNMADAAILGRLADRLLFTITANKTRVDFIRRSIDQLKQIDIDVSGIVLNRFSLKTSGYKYYSYGGKYYYAYAYQYGGEAETEKISADSIEDKNANTDESKA